MKRKALPFAMIVVFVSSLLTGLFCLCMSGDCHAFAGVSETKSAQCHHGEEAAKPRETSRKDCCGKCQLEKAELSSAKIFHARGTIVNGDPAEFAAPLRDPVLKSIRRFQGGREGPPYFFFIQYIFGTTFSFCAPPGG